jgi:aspartyl-tRNA(Asn)/glutamyl-tRNA(Gln) amidotransferase subunit B
MRSKEDAHDYRYFPDPDLLPLVIDDAWVARVRSEMPELPAARRARFASDFGLSAYDASGLTASAEIAAYFEDAVATAGVALAKPCANWIMGELAARLNKEGRDIAAAPVGSAQLARLVGRIADGTISGAIGKKVFDALWNGEGGDGADAVDRIVAAQGLTQINDSSAIEPLVDEVLAANPKSVEEFRAGKEKAFNALVGQVMKATRGKANPQQINDILRRKLAQ